MSTKKNLVAVTAGLFCCGTLIWLSTSAIQGGEKTYELRPQIVTPEYRTDAGRAIDAYERLMERYMDLTEVNLLRLGTDIRLAVKKLDSIDDKLSGLSARIAGIENALGIEQPKPAVTQDNEVVEIETEGQKEPSGRM